MFTIKTKRRPGKSCFRPKEQLLQFGTIIKYTRELRATALSTLVGVGARDTIYIIVSINANLEVCNTGHLGHQ